MDWADQGENVTPHFTVKDCLLLHNWNRLATEDDGADFGKLTALCQKLEEVRDFLGCAMKVHCMFRSTAYNVEQEILLPTGNDVHSQNIAADFDCNSTMSIEEVKSKLEPQLEALGIRMERGTTSWIHIDTREPGPSGRYFTP